MRLLLGGYVRRLQTNTEGGAVTVADVDVAGRCQDRGEDFCGVRWGGQLGSLIAMVKAARSWAPMWALKMVTDRSLDMYLTTEDLARPDNRVTVDGDKIMISWTANNLTPHHELVKRVSRPVRKAGYPIVLTERMGIATNSHMCGTAVAGTDPSPGVLDSSCRSHDVSNLLVVDSSFFPSSAALNPALTIAANALRVAPTIAASAR